MDLIDLSTPENTPAKSCVDNAYANTVEYKFLLHLPDDLFGDDAPELYGEFCEATMARGKWQDERGIRYFITNGRVAKHCCGSNNLCPIIMFDREPACQEHVGRVSHWTMGEYRFKYASGRISQICSIQHCGAATDRYSFCERHFAVILYKSRLRAGASRQ